MSSGEAQLKSIIIGSSNVYRYIEHLDEQLQDIIIMRKCTKIETFKALMSGLGVNDKRVIITVIENFLADAVKGLKDPEEIKTKCKEVLNDFFAVVEETSKRLPNTRFAMVGPMDRPAEPWYSNDLDRVIKEFDQATMGINRSNVSKINSLLRSTQIFQDDKTHLTTESGKSFIKTILFFAGEYFDAVLVEFDEETDMEITSEPAIVAPTSDESGPIAGGSGQQPPTIAMQLEEIRVDTKNRRHNDSMVTARMREEIDFMLNVKKENKIIITGLVTKVAMPNDRADQKKWLMELVGEALNFLLPGAAANIQFNTPGRKIANGVPTMVETQMKTRESAISIRKEYAKKRKEKVDMGNLFVANSVTLATRVRTDILKAIGTKCSNGEVDMFVVSFTSRPVLQIKKKDGSGQHAMTFVDAVARLGKGLSRGDLQTAYARAGSSFEGQLQQNFVVLHDKEGRMAVQKPGGSGGAGARVGGGTKRTLNGTGQASAKRPATARQ